VEKWFDKLTTNGDNLACYWFPNSPKYP
jgi:hypothetical protein